MKRHHVIDLAQDEARNYNKKDQALISSMNSAVENERKFIARELHDHLNAELLFIKLKLRRLKAIYTKKDLESNELENTIDEMIKRVSNVYESSRNIITMLRPEVLDSLGLIGAIEERIDMFVSSQPGCQISLEHEGDFSGLNYQVSIALFRIVQESLTNASKHAYATNIEVVLYLKCEIFPTGIYLCVSDNGRGFDAQFDSHNGIGLMSMRERTYALNGQLQVESTTGIGTRIIASIPL